MPHLATRQETNQLLFLFAAPEPVEKFFVYPNGTSSVQVEWDFGADKGNYKYFNLTYILNGQEKRQKCECLEFYLTLRLCPEHIPSVDPDRCFTLNEQSPTLHDNQLLQFLQFLLSLACNWAQTLIPSFCASHPL